MKALLLLLAAAGLALAADKYTVYETDHFELITDGSRGRAQEILAQFERVRSFFVKVMGTTDPVLKPRIVVFQNISDYRDHSPASPTTAFYIGLPQRDYIAMGPATGDYDRRVAVHEYLHLLVRHSDSPMPVWMNEGMAELYSNIEQIKKIVRVGTPIPEHIGVIRDSWIPLPAVVRADRDSNLYNRREHKGIFYGISWALVHMLSLDARYRGNFSKFTTELASEVSPEDAFQKVYGKSIEEVEKDLQSYIRGKSVSVVNYEVQFDDVDKKVTPRLVTDYEWGIATSDLLQGVRKLDQAAARLEALTNMAAERPEAWESMTFVRWIQKDQSVNAAYAKARSLGSQHPHLAFFAPVFTKDQAEAREALRSAVGKYPSYTEGRIRLAAMYLYNREFQVSFDNLKAIPKINRRHVPEYFPALIQAAWYLGKIEVARAAASQFVKASPTVKAKDDAKKWFAFAMKDPPSQPVAPAFDEQQIALTTVSRPPDDDDDEVPGNRDATDAKVHRRPWTYEFGTLVYFECAQPAMVHLKSDAGGELIKLLVERPLQLPCGEQSRPVSIGYEHRSGLSHGAAGLFRSIEFRQQETKVTSATGTLVNLECAEPGVLHFKTETGTHKILIDSPADLQMAGTADGRGELTCGPQARPAKIGYIEKEGLAGGAIGLARSIDFKP